MEDASVLSSDDPGSKWRRVARFGAGACTLATLIPVEGGRPFWGLLKEILDVALAIRGARVMDLKEALVISFCCLTVPLLLGGPAYLLICSSRSLQTDGKGQLQRGTLFGLWALTAIVPYVFVFKQLPPNVQENELTIGIAISLLSIYLLICGLSYLSSRRAKATPLCIFSMGVLPISMNLVAWSCILGLILIAKPRELTTPLVIAMGFAGALMLFWGWLKWWSAVKKTQPQRTVAATPQIAVIQ
jgi:hypothetical protein